MEFVNEFKTGKKYYFDKKVYMKYHKLYEIPETSKIWVSYCDKKIVEPIDNFDGKIDLYGICPEWCKEVIENER